MQIMNETSRSKPLAEEKKFQSKDDSVKRTRTIKNLSKEQLAQALKKKAECNRKAQKIVERLLDPVDNEEVFLSMLKDINQEHYQDIVEERSISKICGYPICSEKIELEFNQQYHVSAKSKRIYDLTERKYFCSGKCLRYSEYLKSQLLTSPLWLRDTVIIPEFKLMPK